MSRLAIKGGKPVRRKPFPFYKTVGPEEKRAVMRVIDKGILSDFLGSWHKRFYGGHEVRRLEEEWSRYFKVKHAIAVNSCTSGLYCAVAAVGVEPGDEVIVSPYTMSASATAALIFNGVPIFADIENDYFCLDPASVASRITKRTKAIITVDLFGQPYDAAKINRIARSKGLFVIEDAAQAPGARYKDRYAGTLGDIGVYSLNCHKHIQCGEGGVVVTNDARLAEKVRLVRNHAEAVVGKKGEKDIVNMIGYNFRMTELEAAVSREQLKKLRRFVHRRIENCNYIASKLDKIPAISSSPTRNGARHVYYLQPFKFDQRIAGVHRDKFLNAVRAELAPTRLSEGLGVRIWSGYCSPLYTQPVYQKKIAYGKKGFPFMGAHYKGKVSYSQGICPNVERIQKDELFLNDLMHTSFTKKDLNDVIAAFEKVWEHRKEVV
ncbi:MAG: DegT/DnrJ/EryC1/StrS family aminotransferase [Candidatus Omnitrophica bacterium]|nr:DegT/DnrJ/EryC1/StrS family aminotransferase [Candidatus Omnitrophota bacterium]